VQCPHKLKPAGSAFAIPWWRVAARLDVIRGVLDYAIGESAGRMGFVAGTVLEMRFPMVGPGEDIWVGWDVILGGEASLEWVK